MDTKYPLGEEKILMPEMTKPLVTRIKVGRVYGLGNYENKRIEIEVSIPAGHSAADVLIGLERLTDAFSPKCPVDEGEIEYYNSLLKRTDDQWKESNGENWEGDKEDCAKKLAELEAELKTWQAKQVIVRKLLDDLGAAVDYKDHKLDWEEDVP